MERILLNGIVYRSNKKDSTLRQTLMVAVSWPFLIDVDVVWL